MECPVCKKEFDEHTGRRPKKFCSDECKVKFWNVKKRVASVIYKAQEKTFIETHDAVMETRTTTKGILPTSDNSEKIKELEEELQTVPDVGLGKKRRSFIQSQIYKLKKQL